MLKGFSSYTISDMKIFHCDHCGHLLFFENTECVSCRHRVAYLPDLRLVGSLDPDGDDKWRSPLPRAAEGGYRLCQNYTIEGDLQLGGASRATTTRSARRAGSRG